jgi:hypothetical protein
MNVRFIAALAALMLNVVAVAPEAFAAKTDGAKSSPATNTDDKASAKPGVSADQLDNILSLPANIAPTDSPNVEPPVNTKSATDVKNNTTSEQVPGQDSASGKATGATGEDRPVVDTAANTKSSSTATPDRAQSSDDTANSKTSKGAKNSKAGGAGAYPALVPQTAKADLVGAEDADPTLLKGNVSDSGAINPLLKPILPELDCMGFAAHANEAAIKFLKSQIAKGNGYLTDGGAWARSGDYPFMITVYEGDSCDKAGIEVGDIMLELNGVNLYRASDETVNNACALYDGNLRNHFVLKRGDRTFRVTTQCWWHSFGSGSAEEKLWKDTMHKFAKQL